MTEELERKMRVARTKHVCGYCGGTIERGETYEYSKFVDGGVIFEWHSHDICRRIVDGIADYIDSDDGVGEEEFDEGCRSVCERFVCPDCPRWNKAFDECDDDKRYCLDKLDAFLNKYELYETPRTAGDWFRTWKCRERSNNVES